ncbi:MAG: 3-methyl-2-oxobutanoate hydroxymethyltransferase [Labilithrix sp.]|nr:3-methyl-2-oxobutanoate hydroxymethyltransferase [Labilithrix sp.]MCW5814119.1 3-methyl-2-oxobutanoate hydroxymethyltransferase [Labilithrix sp.]
MYSSGPQKPSPAAKKVTVPDLRARKGGAKIAMVTAYDYTMARLVDEAGADMVLVGDSLGMIVQGLSTTIPVTLEEMAYHSRAVARALTTAHLTGDLPFMSYQVSPAQAVESAGKLMKDGACESVKLEGGQEVAEHVHRIVRAGIPVVGHVGLTPQSVHALGGFKVQGRGEGAEKVLADAIAVEQAGAFAIVLEAVPPDLAERITSLVSVPTIGIGAGAGCDGQVLVCTDLLGLSRGHQPKFAKRFANLGDLAVDAIAAYVADVRSGAFPAAAHSYKPNAVASPSRSPMLRRDLGIEVEDLDSPLPLDHWH